MSRRRAVILGFLLLVACCDGPSSPSPRARTYRMGFSNIPPSPDQAVVLATLNLWAERADAAIMHVGVPWAAMLADTTAEAKVRGEMVPLANFYRAHGFQLVVTVDVTDGLNRSAEAPELVAAGRSITDTAIQRLYREFVSAVDTILRPEYLGLAAETNLIRVAAPDSVYGAVVTMANAAAAEQRGLGTTAQLYVSVQVEVAWGRFSGSNVFEGIAQDRSDFPFVDALGLSSYPYLGGFSDPDQLPLDYYARIDAGDPIPLLVVEGGWASQSAGGFVTSPVTQARYIHRQAELLDSARAVAVFQLSFADLALSLFPPQPPGSILPLFATLGLVDTVLTPKPSLAAWDSIFARPHEALIMRLLAFAASLRRESLNQRLINVAVPLARELGAEVDLADFREFEMPIYDGDVMAAVGLAPGAQALKARIEAADGMMIASPEYNYSLGGPLKNAIDWVSRARPMPFRGKSALLLATSNGAYGGVRGLWQLRIPLEGCGTFVNPEMFALPYGEKAFTAEGALVDPAVHQRLRKMIEGFLGAARALAARA